MAEYGFRQPKSVEDEERCVLNAIPKSTRYKNKWAARIFEEWGKARFPKVATLEPGGLFKEYDLHKVQSFNCNLEKKSFSCMSFGDFNNCNVTFNVTKTPSTRIRIFLNPQLFLSGYGYRPHAYGEFASESGNF